MELTFDNETKATDLHNLMIAMCRQEVEQVMEKCFDEFSPQDKILYFKKLELNLGNIDYSELRTELPVRISEALRKVLSDSFLGEPNSEVEVKSIWDSGMESICSFLQYGFLSWHTKQTDVSFLLQECLSEREIDLVRFIRKAGTSRAVRERITERFSSSLLQKVIKALEPQQGQLIIDYHGHLVRLNNKEAIVKTPQTVLERTMWLFVFSNLLLEQGSVFNAKSFAKSLLRQFACHYNITFNDLMALVTNGFKKWEGGLPPSFFNLLQEINDELIPVQAPRLSNADQSPSAILSEFSVFINQLEGFQMPAGQHNSSKTSASSVLRRLLEKEPHHVLTALRRIKSRKDSIQRFVEHVGRELPEKIVKVIEPGESETIIDYHRNLIALHTIDPIANVTQRELEGNLWTFMIVSILENHGSYFNHKSFLKSLISATAAHYNLVENTLLQKLSISAESLPSRVSRVNNFFRIVKEIYVEANEEVNARVIKSSDKETSKKQRLLVRVEQLLMGWRQGQAKASERPEQLVLAAIRREHNAVNLVKKYLSQDLVQARLASFTEGGFLELIGSLFSSQSVALIRQVIILFHDMTRSMAPWFGSKANYKKAVKKALLEMAVEIQNTGPLSNQNMIKRFIKKIGSKGNALTSERITNYIVTYLADPRLSLIKAVVSESNNIQGKTAVVDNVTEDIIQWLISSTRKQPVYSEFNSYNEVLQFVCTHYAGNFLSSLVKKTPRQRQRFINRLSGVELDLLMTMDAQERRTWHCTLLQNWETHLMGLCRREELLINLKRVILLDQIGNGAFSDDSVFGQLVNVLEKYQTPYSFFERLQQWSLPVHGDVTHAIRKIERQVIGSGSRLADTKKRAARIKIIKESVSQVIEKSGENKNSVTKEIKEEGIYLSNAGLVLIHPYITFLFEQCNLINDGRFVNSKACARAVAMLHYAASGNELYREEDYALNKLLCGLDIESVSGRVKLKKGEKAMVRGMLMALAAHWEIINKSNEDDVRGNWLVREGRLRETESHWELVVKRNAYDLLLDSLPFTLSPIKYTWMRKMILINWL